MLYYIISFFFGASIGSFVQVVATRLNVANIMSSRSKCLSCGETLRAYDLVPVISYLFLRGKCRHCSSKYGIESLLIEVLFGFIYVFLYHFILSGQISLLMFSWWLLYYSVLFITFGVISIYDWRHTYIPVIYLLVYSILTFLMLIIRFVNEPSNMVLISPVIIALPFLFMWLITKGKGVGFGDVLLFLGVGAFFGVLQGFAVLFISVWIGAVIGIFIYLIRRKHGIKNRAIPFVPFIFISFLIVLFTNIDIFSIAYLFSW